MMPESVRRWAYWSSIQAELLDISWIEPRRRTRTLVHEFPETVVVLDEAIEPLLDLLSTPEDRFAL
jgi:hypothetical protein